MGGGERGEAWGVALACVCGGSIGVGIGAVMGATLGDVGLGIALGAGFAVVFAVAFQPHLDADPGDPARPDATARPGGIRRFRAPAVDYPPLVGDVPDADDDDVDDGAPGVPRWDLS